MHSEHLINQGIQGSMRERQHSDEALLADAAAKLKDLQARFSLLADMTREVFDPQKAPDGSLIEFDRGAWSEEFDRVSREMDELRSYMDELAMRIDEKREHTVAS